MNRDCFWLTDDQFATIEPYLPTDTRGKPRVDDRRVISGIIHVIKTGGRWVDAPRLYGPHKTLYNRFVRWAAKGVWIDLFHALAGAGGPPAQVLIDSSAVKAHRSASGGKGGAQPGDRTLARRPLDQDPCADRPPLPTHRLPADRRSGRRLRGSETAPRAPAYRSCPSRRQRLRHRRASETLRGQRHIAQHSAQSEPALEELLLVVMVHHRS
jgi:transposase